MSALLGSLGPLVQTLRARGYVVVGPTVRDCEDELLVVAGAAHFLDLTVHRSAP